MKPPRVATTTHEVAAGVRHFYNVGHVDDSMGFVPDYDAIRANPVVNGNWNPGAAHLMLQTPALVLSAAHSTLYSYVDRDNIATWLTMKGVLRSSARD